MTPQFSRREFLASSSAAAIGLTALTLPKNGAYAAGEEAPLKVGLIGCGGRGTDAARQALRADKNVKLWAMADAFSDRLESSRNSLSKVEDVSAKIDVPPERRFVGFNAYQDVIACCDVVLLTTPPQFRPLHLQAAVDAGKHVFAEKPCAVDAPGVRKVLAICKEAEQKKLSNIRKKLRKTPEWNEDPLFKGDEDDSFSVQDDFIAVLDRQGKRAYVRKEHIYVYFNDTREFTQAPYREDETDYRLEEPLPRRYPLSNPAGFRGQFLVGIVQPYNDSYPYLRPAKTKGYASPIDISVSLMKEAGEKKKTSDQ